MKILNRASGLLCLCTLLFSGPAFGNLSAALEAYQKQKFETALEQFWELAELGNAQAQYALGLMYMRGEGASRNTVLAYGWLKLAADAGQARAADALVTLRSQMLPESVDAAERWSLRYTPKALQERLLPNLQADAGCESFKPAKVTYAIKPAYPVDVRGKRVNGAVSVKLTIASDGSIHDAHIIRAFPPNMFEGSVIEAVSSWTLRPAKKNGVATYSERPFYIAFNLGGDDADIAFKAALQELKHQAEDNDSVSQYTYSLMLSTLQDDKEAQKSATTWLTKAAEAGIPMAQYELGDRLLSAPECRPSLEQGFVWLLAAAQQDQPDAQTELGRIALRTRTPEDERKALFWLRRASDLGDMRARKYLAAVFAAAPDPDVCDPARAIGLAESISTTIFDEATIAEILAAASANAGNFAEAANYEQSAITAARRLRWATDEMQLRLKAYKSEQPWFGELIPF